MSADSTVVVRGGTVVTMDDDFRVVRGDVTVVAGRIASIGDSSSAPADARVIDASGMHVLPGLIQGHTHLGQALLRGLAEGRELLAWLRERVWPLEAAHDHDSAYWSGMLGAADCLLAGTTTIQDIGIVTNMDAIYEAIRDSGLRAIAGKCLMDTGDGVPGRLIQSRGEALAEARDLHSRWHGAAEGRVTTAVCPRFILSCSRELWSGSVELSRELGLPVHTHLLEHPREEIEVREALGCGQMEFLDGLGVLDTDLRIAHGVQLRDEHRDILRGRTLSVTHCPSANLKLGSGIADLGYLSSCPEIRLGIGCDGAPCNNDMDVLEEIRLAALLQGVRQAPGRFSARDALSLATREGARAVGMAHEIGSIEPGKLGDLVVLDLDRPASFGADAVSPYDRIVYGAARDAVQWVLVGGRVVVERGRLPRFDADELRRRPLEEVHRLLARAELSRD